MLTIGQKAGNWVLEDLVSLGIPRTFRARHGETGTRSLLKIVPQSKATTEQQKRECVALNRLRHPSLPEVLDFGVDHEHGVVWTAFQWFEGEALHDRLQRGPPDWREVSRILADLAGALAYVHREGLVHRDLRPANAVVGEGGRAWLVGFEFSMTQTELESLSQAPFGDLAYLAPEVLRDPIHHGAKADVYAFGCLAFELLSGRAAFPAAAWGERPDQAIRMLEWKTRVKALDPGPPAPDWLRSMVAKCSDPLPEKRLPDIDALVGWLDAARPAWSAAPPPEEDPLLEPVTSEVPTVVATLTLPPPSLVAAPSLRRVAPPALVRDESSDEVQRSLQGEPPPPSLERRAPREPARSEGAGTSMSLQYALAVVLGGLSAFGFSAVLILFVEMSNGTL